jgi:hypothetical protein
MFEDGSGIKCPKCGAGTTVRNGVRFCLNIGGWAKGDDPHADACGWEEVLPSHVGASEAKSAASGFASTGGSAPSLAAKHGETCAQESPAHGKAPVVNLVCSAPLERFAALVQKWREHADLLYLWANANEREGLGFEAQFLRKKAHTLRVCAKGIESEIAANSGPAAGQKATSSLERGAGERATARNGAALRQPTSDV